MRPIPTSRFASTVVSTLALGLFCTLPAMSGSALAEGEPKSAAPPSAQGGQGAASATSAGAPSRSGPPQGSAAARAGAKSASNPLDESLSPDAAEPDYYARRAAEVLKQDGAAVAAKPHPLAAEHPDFSVVVCVAGCPRARTEAIVSMLPKPEAKVATAGMMITTASGETAAAEGATIDCIAGCYDDTPKAYMARLRPEPETPIAVKATETAPAAEKSSEPESAETKPAAQPTPEPKSAEVKPAQVQPEPAGSWETTVSEAAGDERGPMPQPTDSKEAPQASPQSGAGNWNDKVNLDRTAEKGPAPAAEPVKVAPAPAVAAAPEAVKSEAKAAPAAEAKPAAVTEAKPVVAAAPAAVEAKPEVAVSPAAPEAKTAAPAAQAAAETKPAAAAPAAPEAKTAAPAAQAAVVAKPAAAAPAAAEAKPAAPAEQKVAALEEPAASPQAAAKDTVMALRSGDAAMDGAIAKARETISEFWAKMEKPGPGETEFALKVAISEKDKVEYLWLTDVVKTGGKLTGTISNDPELVKSVKAGQRYDFSEDRIADWLYKRNGKLVGNETMRPLLARMPKKDAETYRAMYEKP